MQIKLFCQQTKSKKAVDKQRLSLLFFGFFCISFEQQNQPPKLCNLTIVIVLL